MFAIIVSVMVAEMSNDLVAEWEVSLGDGKHLIQFCHGTLTGKRVIIVDGKVTIYKNKANLSMF